MADLFCRAPIRTLPGHDWNRIRPERITPAPESPVDATAVAALLYSPDGRFLLQLRDDRPGISLPGHWALFAGQVEQNESPDQAILREIEEELSWRPPALHWFSESVQSLPRPHKPVVRRIWYQGMLPGSDLSLLRQTEGQEMRLFTLDEMLRLDRIAPWDVAVVLLLARQAALFPS